MKIAYISGGGFRHIDPYIIYMRDQGHEVHWFTINPPERDFGVYVHDISFGALAHNRSSKWLYILAGLRIRKILKKIRPDILHAHYATSAGTVAWLSGYQPYIVSVRGSDLIDSIRHWIWRKILRSIFCRAQFVHTVSDQLTDLSKKLGVQSEQSFTLTQGVDTKLFFFQPYHPNDSTINLVCTRNLYPVYDPVTIIRAATILKQSAVPFHLTMAGAGAMEPELKNLVRKHGLEDHMTFLGGYSNVELPDLLRRNTLYLSASRWDGTSISLLEAMACGLFPIVTRIQSNMAWVQDGQTCLMFDPEDATGLSQCIVRAIEDGGLLQSAIDQNRKLIETKADRDKNMAKLEEVYYQMIATQE